MLLNFGERAGNGDVATDRYLLVSRMNTEIYYIFANIIFIFIFI